MDDPVARNARERPGALAIRAGGRELTYPELDARVAASAQRLSEQGVAPGDRVATDLPPTADFAILLHALPRLGAVLVPIAPRLPERERERLLERASPRLVVAGSAAELAVEAEELPIHEQSQALVLAPDAPSTLLFTSGSTAAPKLVELTYANHLASAQASAANLGVEPDDRWLCPLPLHHIGGLAILLRSAIYGTAAIVHERFDADAVRASLESGEATLVSLVATQLRRLAEAGLERAPALRAGLVGGGPVPHDLLEWAAEHGLPLVQTYGMTETASQIATLPVADALAGDRRGSAGRPLDGVELAVEAGSGELIVRGPMVSRGAVAADGWLHTGDRGALDAAGYLSVEGRIDATIVTGGENVAAAEVEQALETHPAVAEAAVVGRPDAEWGELVVAYVVLARDATPLDDAELVAHVRGRLAAPKAPKEIHRVDGLPRTPSGQVARARLRSAPSGEARLPPHPVG